MWGAKYGGAQRSCKVPGRKIWGARYGDAKCRAQSVGRKVWGAKWVNPTDFADK